MNLNEALKLFEATEANLRKLDKLWSEIEAELPDGRDVGVNNYEKYLQLAREFAHIQSQMPKVDGIVLENRILHPDDIAQLKVDALELDEFSVNLSCAGAISAQGEILQTYRFHLERKRRELARESVLQLCREIDSLIVEMGPSAKRVRHNAAMPQTRWTKLRAAFKGIDALLGESVGRPSGWNDMSRHLGFGLKVDYNDIRDHDWPTIRPGLERSLFGAKDPIPVPVADLGELVSSKPKGRVSTELRWGALSPESFERLVFNVIDRSPGYENPQWLTHTNAPDRGRDLSVERITNDPLVGSRRARVILACKHTPSVNLQTTTTLREQMKLWEHPRVDELIVVTTGRFSTDAISWVERHNLSNDSLRIELWPNSHLERLLAFRPDLIAEFGLRP